MYVSVVIPTRNRGHKVLPCAESILADSSFEGEVIIVDQSTSDATAVALRAAGWIDDPRLRYQRTSSQGASAARNEGMRLARGQIVAFIDDDCVASKAWAQRIANVFRSDSHRDLFFGAVVAGLDASHGWIPEFYPSREGLVASSPTDVIRSLGFTANFAMRKTAADRIGQFDELMGPGAPIPNGEDTDLGYRALRAGLGIYTALEPSVTHYGLRRHEEQAASASRYLRGMATMCMKHVRCGDLPMALPILRECRSLALAGTINLLHGRRPSGYRGAASLITGTLDCFRFGVDPRLRLYRPRQFGRQRRGSALDAALILNGESTPRA